MYLYVQREWMWVGGCVSLSESWVVSVRLMPWKNSKKVNKKIKKKKKKKSLSQEDEVLMIHTEGERVIGIEREREVVLAGSGKERRALFIEEDK
jgi:hypothetical protein